MEACGIFFTQASRNKRKMKTFVLNELDTKGEGDLCPSVLHIHILKWE